MKNDDGVSTIAYQGVEGSYSSLAVAEYDPKAERIGYPTFDAVVAAVQNDEATHAFLPIENSTAGRVADLHHLLPKSGLTVIAEYFLPIRHALIALKGASLKDVKHVYSHREALSQCTNTLRALNIEPVPYGDTAKAVSFVSETGNEAYAALASTYAAELHDTVHIVQENLQDADDNVTRFLVLTKDPATKPLNGDCITSLVYDVLDKPAALYESLGSFAKHGVNIIKLESFVPMQRHKEAHFYLECLGKADESPLQEALVELQGHTKHILVLGTYEKSSYRKNFDKE
ncbi:MAG: prephenate dehydratase [Parcubacteria group bacterium]|jgi:prephenate dehydratase|nr:prephenate dehydratase [Parcubacteria group bacterium]|tara:strand:+ start:5629 stop:6492 length:864 start_codon:yes stop_codon:yes gene_type:complete